MVGRVRIDRFSLIDPGDPFVVCIVCIVCIVCMVCIVCIGESVYSIPVSTSHNREVLSIDPVAIIVP